MNRIFVGFFVLLCSAPLGLLSQINYQYYKGNLHAHTAFSDGSKDCLSSHVCSPEEAFEYAKGSLYFDFLGISEHNHTSAGMSLAHYAEGLSAADAATTPNFVGLYGMEWGIIATGGHLLIYGYDSLIGWNNGNYDVYNPQNDYNSLFAKINAYPGAIAYLAHPTTNDYNNFFSTPYQAFADSAVVGMAIRSGPAYSTDTTYSNPSGSSFFNRYRDALKLGYHLGVGIDHDNHYTTFGRSTKARLIAMATSLTRQNLMDAMRKMRYYASDDWNAHVEFTINGQVMGSSLRFAGQPSIKVQVNDQDLENTASIKIYYGIPGSGVTATVLTSNTNNNSLIFQPSNLLNQTEYYFFAEIKQADGDMIWTSPIWFTRDDAVTSAAPEASFRPTSPATICEGREVSFLDWSSNAPDSWSWTFPGGTPGTSAIVNPVIHYATPGIYDVQLQVSNSSGTDAVTIPQTVTVHPNPAVPVISQSGNVLTSTPAAAYQWFINGILINGATSQSYTMPQQGNYTVKVTNTFGCTTLSGPLPNTGLQEMEASQVKVYPNPTKGILTIEFEAGKKSDYLIQVVNASGAVVFETREKGFSGSYKNNVNLENQASGNYFIKITHQDTQWIKQFSLNP